MTPLPRPSIDTGAGLERLASVLQGKLSNFETDLFRPLIEEAAALANVEYGANHDADVSLRIIADHARSATFLISDGVLPSNEGRGYVLRLIMRRALYHGQTLGLKDPFLYKISSRVVDMMKDAYPELVQAAPHIAKGIKIEEERYARTTLQGLEVLDSSRVVIPSGLTLHFKDVRKHLPNSSKEVKEVFFGQLARGFTDAYAWWLFRLNEIGSSAYHLLTAARKPPIGSAPTGPSPVRIPPEGTAWISGDDLFALHDTFGLRPEFVRDVVKSVSSDLDVDLEGYDAEMQKQRERARASWKGAEKKVASPAFAKLAEGGKTVFDGYAQTTSADCKIVALVVGGELVPEVPAGAKVEIILDHTPFYSESGGQVGDTGHLQAQGSDQSVAHVQNTFQPVSGLIVHKSVARQAVRVGDTVSAVVDAGRRDATRRNHTATHLLHAALRKTLGTHVKQAGSLVAPDRLRFDFTHYTGLSEQDVLDIEDLVNQHVLANEEMQTKVMDLDAAVNTGAMALFGEKYGDQVRVVSVGDGSYSRELCGGTHVRRTGDIGLFKVVSEGSVAAGTRRIEALTGTGVLEYLRRESQTLTQVSQALRAKPGEVIEAIEKLSESEKKLRKELEAQQMKRAASAAGDLLGQAREIKGVKVIAASVEVTDRAAMRQMIDDLRGKLQSGVIVLGSAAEGRVSLIAAVTKDLTGKLDAGKIVKQASTYVEGSGGGRKDLAEAGGKNPAKLDEAIQAVAGIVEQML
jgi:alanyl-tRNA synthetase